MIENPITAGTISGTQTICSGNIPAEITSLTTPTVAGAASTTYQWHSSTDNFATFNVIDLNSPNYQPPALNQTTQFRRVDRAVLNSKTCSTTSNEITITVSPGPGGQLQMNGAAVVSATICSSDDPTFTISGGTGQSFEWRIDGVVEATTATPSFNASSVTYTLTGVEVIDVLVYDLPLDGGNIDP
ncbi:MAG: hypothetical protein ACPH4K_08845, partial [Flavobacteriaceae bacterium]